MKFIKCDRLSQKIRSNQFTLFFQKKPAITQITFATILEVAAQLLLEDQENLIDISQKLLRDHCRTELVQKFQQIPI